MSTILPALALIAATVASSAAPAPRAVVAHHSVTVAGPPRLRVEVPKDARYVGGERFVLYGNADAELHVFVEADKHKRVRRLYWIQQEEYLPAFADKQYTYGKHDRKTTLWGDTAWISSAFGKSDIATRPGSDRDQVRAILAKAGYSWPATMMQVRMVRLLDDPAGTGFGRRELMLIYAEDLDVAGEDYAALGGDGDGTDRWRAVEPALVERGGHAFAVSPAR